MGENGTYSINDLERLTGIKAHTLRIWEKRYGLCDPDRSNGNIRKYNDQDLRYLLSVSILNKRGFKISEIAGLREEELKEKLGAQINGNQSDHRIEEMILAMLSMDEASFRHVLGAAMVDLGLEDTFSQLIQPFFDRIGIMWLAGSINPAQEHFVSNIIRQKLIVAINSLSPEPIDHKKTFLLFLPENEQHEMGLLLYTYIIKKEGHKVIYLGQSTPLECVKNVMETQKADIMVSAITASLSEDDLKDYLLHLRNAFPGTPLLLGGYQVMNNHLPWLENQPEIYRIHHISDLRNLLQLYKEGILQH
jgi:DNA-binding transcriptional MerR regulator/methylmalonyl-CoA mutase cobalamin-binding subunit